MCVSVLAWSCSVCLSVLEMGIAVWLIPRALNVGV